MGRRALRGVGMLCAAGAVALGGTRVPGVLAGMETFRVERVVVEGVRYLEDDAVVAAAALPSGANVWDDRAPVEERVRSHPLVQDARIHRRLPGTLVVEVTEREPVALVPTPTLVPVDRHGRVLPLDPAAHRLDLPLLRVGGLRAEGLRVEGQEAREPEGAGRGVPAGRLLSHPARLLAGEVARLEGVDPGFVGMVSELSWSSTGEVVAWWGDSGIQIRFRPPLSSRRIREAMTVLADASATNPDRRIAGVDLHYADQVVVRYENGTE